MQSCMSQYYNYSIIRNRRPTSSPQSTVPTKSFWTVKTRFGGATKNIDHCNKLFFFSESLGPKDIFFTNTYILERKKIITFLN